MKKLIGIMLVVVLMLSFVFGVMASSGQAKMANCYTYCDGIYQVECCKSMVPQTGGGWTCWYTGLYCA